MKPSPQTIYHYDAFSTHPSKGNPAGIVLNADTLTDAQMQTIAKQIGFNETAFICQSSVADLRFRYFTPGHEMKLCGHATIASLVCLKENGLLPNHPQLTLETGAGILKMTLSQQNNHTYITMNQATPEFIPFQGDRRKLAAALGISLTDIEETLPITYGSTGIWTLLIPIKDLTTFTNMTPNTPSFPTILTQNPHCSIHPFCLSAHNKHCQIHSRHFSSPYSGTIEDPVTGTASGVIGAYYATYIDNTKTNYHLTMEQGQELGRDGEVSVTIVRCDSSLDVSIIGTAVFVKQLPVAYY